MDSTDQEAVLVMALIIEHHRSSLAGILQPEPFHCQFKLFLGHRPVKLPRDEWGIRAPGVGKKGKERKKHKVGNQFYKNRGLPGS